MITGIILGTGDRGNIYAEFSKLHPEKFKIVGCAEIEKEKRKIFAKKYELNPELVFSNWEKISGKNIADAIIITLPDKFHFSAAKKFLQLGYHVLLEKPMTTDPKLVLELIEIDENSPGILQICHVLRYTKFYNKISEIVSSGELGNIVSIHMSENVGYYHYAHSFVRGNWNNRNNSGPFILTKSTHDLDILYWLTNSLPRTISSFGSQQFFGRSNKPEGVSVKRCTDGCEIENSCVFYAPKLYLDLFPLVQINSEKSSFIPKYIQKLGYKFPNLKKYYPFNKINDYYGWPVNIITSNPTINNRKIALENGPYGRCVYEIEDHDIVDNQVVIIEFENGITASFNLHGFATEEKRTIRIDGTKSTLEGIFSIRHNTIELTDKINFNRKVIALKNNDNGHGGGDNGIISDFIDNIENSKSHNKTTSKISSISHLIAFAADKSRLDHKTVNFENFVDSLRSI